MTAGFYKGKLVTEYTIKAKVKTEDGKWHDMYSQIEDEICELSDRMFEKLEMRTWNDETKTYDKEESK